MSIPQGQFTQEIPWFPVMEDIDDDATVEHVVAMVGFHWESYVADGASGRAPGLPQTGTRAGTALHHPAAQSRMETALDMFGDAWII